MLRDIILIAIFVAVAHGEKQYRPDYEYNRKTDAFYKLHTDSLMYSDAKTVCQAEYAKLMVASPLDVLQAHGMLKRFPDIGGLIWAGEDGETHNSVDDYDQIELTVQEFISGDENFNHHPQCEVITRDGQVRKIDCLTRYPFICKVEAKDVYWNSQCNVFTPGYEYVESVGSCYRISRPALSWDQAYEECQAEGAHLLVLNSDHEREAVHNLTIPVETASELPLPVKEGSPTGWFYAGIRAKKTIDGSRVFKTIFGQTLEEAGYAEWCPGEPNNWGKNELCGSITKSDGKYNDIACSHTTEFICEKEVNVQTSNK